VVHIYLYLIPSIPIIYFPPRVLNRPLVFPFVWRCSYMHCRCDAHGMIATTNHAQGKERNIIFFSIVINPGLTRVPMREPFPIGFVADPNSLNVSFSRGRIARYTVRAAVRSCGIYVFIRTDTLTQSSLTASRLCGLAYIRTS
jgi:hypothetical protein